MGIRKTIFGRVKYKPNTFIGGIAKLGGTGVNATINTKALLASKLGISESRISMFLVSGNDVSCRISGNYALPPFGDVSSASLANQNITTYIDKSNLVDSQSGTTAGFSNCNQLVNIKLDGINTAASMFVGCTNPSLVVSMTSLKNTTNLFFSVLPTSFTQAKLVGFPSLENLGIYAFHNISGFTEIILANAKTIITSTFYNVRNCEKYILNEVISSVGGASGTWRHGNHTCKLVEMKKNKTISGDIIGYSAGTNIVHPTDFKMRLNISVSSNSSVLAVKSNFPHAVIEFYDDAGNYVSTL